MHADNHPIKLAKHAHIINYIGLILIYTYLASYTVKASEAWSREANYTDTWRYTV